VEGWRHTGIVHHALNFEDEVPDFGAAFGILEAQRIVGAIGLGPHDKGFCQASTSASRAAALVGCGTM
jgi:hypothetical protein